MRYVGFALLGILLAASVAHATVYVWKDREGALVLTNDPGQLEDAPHGPLITYATTESSPSPPAAAGGGDAGGGDDAGGADAVAAPSADRTEPAPAPVPVDGAPRTLDEANAQHLIAAATTPTERAAVEPRALLDVAARAEPPRVIVRIVSSSAGPLSTPDEATAPRSGGSRGPSGRTRRLGGDDASSLASDMR